jgi:hypothetical protein
MMDAAVSVSFSNGEGCDSTGETRKSDNGSEVEPACRFAPGATTSLEVSGQKRGYCDRVRRSGMGPDVFQ